MTPSAAQSAVRTLNSSPTDPYDIGDLRTPQATARLRQQLAKDGLALFHGTSTPASLLAAAATVMTVLPHPTQTRTASRPSPTSEPPATIPAPPDSTAANSCPTPTAAAPPSPPPS